MFLVNWFYGVLNSLGLANVQAHILFLGLDNAGKTTLLRVLRDDKVITHVPTRMPQYEELVIGKIHFKAHDLGGHTAARRYVPFLRVQITLVLSLSLSLYYLSHSLTHHPLLSSSHSLWKKYFAAVDGIVFLVDSADVKRMEKTKEELNALLMSDELKDVPFLILGNKIDKPGALSKAQLKESLGVSHSCTGEDTKRVLAEGQQPIEIFMCSVVKRAGYAEGFRWLSHYLS
jgi:GTP-binding protein SAR1